MSIIIYAEKLRMTFMRVINEKRMKMEIATENYAVFLLLKLLIQKELCGSEHSLFSYQLKPMLGAENAVFCQEPKQ